MHNYDWLIGRLDEFIRKYYANKLIKGLLVFFSCLLFFIITVSVGEYFLYFPVWTKLFILSIFLISGLAALIGWIIIPLAQMGRLGKLISYEQAANIIGTFFPEVSDKLLNILQLKNNTDVVASKELAEASINQKINKLSVIPITKAIEFSKNRKYIPYLASALLIVFIILFAAPNIFSESSKRLLQPTKQFEKPAPFQFVIKNNSLLGIRHSDYTIQLETKGATLPAESYIVINNEKYPMQNLENHSFQYTFRNLNTPIDFKFYAGGFYSSVNTLNVASKPELKSFQVQLIYPSYIGKKNEIRNSLGDMTLPVGTTINLAMAAAFTDDATIKMGTGKPYSLLKNATLFAFQYRFLNDTTYTITLSNKESPFVDSFQYQVQVIPDQYPVVQVQQFKDSLTGKQILLSGTAGDDYGITKVTFNYEITEKDKVITSVKTPIKITGGVLSTFEHYVDIETLNILPGQKLSYYIEAWDNDGVHGGKSSRSEVMSYQMFDIKKIDSAINENSKQINSGLSNSAEKTKQLQNEYKDMQSKMLQSNNMDWEQQQSMKEMMEKQLELKNQLENVKKRFDEQTKETDLKNLSDDVKEKQEDLKKQMDNLLNKELKDQIKKLQEMMAKMNKEQTLEAMKQMEQENKLFKMDMERMQALMKKLEMQMRMEDMANKLEDLAKKQDDLKDKTEKEQKDANELNKEQKELEKELNKMLKEDMKDLDKLSKETKEEKKLDEPKEKGKEATDEMKKSEEELSKKQNSNAGKSQNKASDKMKEMAKSMRESAGGMSPEEIDIDIKATRQILSNLIRLSFDQEDLMDKVRQTSTSSKDYVVNQEEQNRLHANSIMIRDSMFSLSKRIPKMATTINKETTDLEHYLQLSVDELEDRNIGMAISHEQYIMTHTNNLALMLNEVLANLMQNQMKPSEGSAGSCSKPGGKKPKPGPGNQLSDIITQQQNLGDAMQQMKSAMAKKNGNKPGDKSGEKPGEKPGGEKPRGKDGKSPGKGQKPGGESNGSGKGGSGNGENGDNDAEQLARLAEQQAALRQKIQDLTNELNSKGMAGNAKALREIEQKMDKNESDIVNRRISEELILRQKEIQSRLLETDKALRDQEQDDKRSSKKGEEISRPIPPQLQKYLTDQKHLLELYKTVPPQLKPYYKDMVDNYFKMIGNK